MDLIYMNSAKEDQGVILDYTLDLAFGNGENDFSLTMPVRDATLATGGYIYLDGTEYGGIIDALESDTSNDEVTYSGRSWHGILNSKVLQPDAGQDYLILNGEANTVLGQLLTRMGLTSLFSASTAQSGITISNYKMDRYIKGYSGILKMLNRFGAKLVMSYHLDHVIISASAIVDHTQEAIDNDQIDLKVTKTTGKVNHLICLGQGELSARTVVHLYADASGNISQTQSIFGIDEYTDVYDYSNAEDRYALIAAGTDRLNELLQQDALSVDFDSAEEGYDIGDIVGAIDNVTGVAISVPITKKIVKVESGEITVSLDIDPNNVSAGSTASGGELPQPYLPLSGGEITGDLSVDGNLTCLRFLNYRAISREDIPSNADLNDYWRSGHYRATSNSVAATIGNCPVTVAFTLDVYAGNGSEKLVDTPTTNMYITQRVEDYYGRIYVRTGETSSGTTVIWHSWERLMRTENYTLPVSSSVAITLTANRIYLISGGIGGSASSYAVWFGTSVANCRSAKILDFGGFDVAFTSTGITVSNLRPYAMSIGVLMIS